MFIASGDAFSVTYQGGTGNDEVLTFLNTVATWTGPATGAIGAPRATGARESCRDRAANVYIGAGNTVGLSGGGVDQQPHSERHARIGG